ncbi:MAG: transcription termination/antitermination protein NusA [Lachnospiraceae bacterium]|nr:transcription termination/antitermination protein NusA [Lachnospiraceae bacterium]MBQ2577458.1 transcription termination/antitermination protein NusA [Lachnospiraceae bacterium]MCR4731914.1 transcription termination factor NusA [Lachnospiraceae bacterium]
MANSELLDALTVLEKEKNISRDTILATIEDALLVACKNNYGSYDNFSVTMDSQTCEYHVFAAKEVVEEVFDPVIEISLEEAHEIDGSFKMGDVVNVEIKSQNFGRIATSAAKGVILQKLKEEERNLIYDEYEDKAHTIITGTVSRYIGKNISVNLGKTDAILTESEQIKGEHYNTNDRIKVYVLEVRKNPRGPRIRVSRTHPDLVRCLFTEEVSEVREGIVEIKGIAREAGNRSKIAVWSNDPDVDPVGACVGMNGSRVNAIVNELGNEKIDVVEWNENPAMLIENALSPAKVIAVVADSDEKTAKVVVPDYQLSLAIGREGQNARLAARLTGFKIDIKSETQAREAGDFLDYEEEYDEDEYFDEEEYYEETAAEDEAEATEE